MISTFLTLPYELARLPLVVVGDSVSERLPETSVARVTLDRAIGSADKLAGTVLRNRDILERGTQRLERSEQLLAAARLQQDAAARREQARESAAAGRQEAAEKRRTAQDHAASGLDRADAVEAQGKQEAEAKAAKAAAAKKKAADQRAASRAATAERRKAGVDAAAEAKKQTAQREAKTKLDDAQETKESAEAARADADRLSDLTETKKQERKQG